MTLRRLLDGYAAPGRVRRLQDRQQPRRRGWLRRLGRWRWWQRFVPRQQAPLTVVLVRSCWVHPCAVKSHSTCWTAGCLGERTISLQDGHAPEPPPAAARYRRPCSSSSADHRSLAAPSSLILAPTTGHGAHSGIPEVLAMVGVGRLGWVTWWAGCRAAGVITTPVPGRAWPVRPAAAVQRLAVAATSDGVLTPALGWVAGLPASCWPPSRRPPARPTPAESAADPPADPAATLRIGDPTLGVLAAHGRWQARLMSATHRR